jgi:hypothetical protein
MSDQQSGPLNDDPLWPLLGRIAGYGAAVENAVAQIRAVLRSIPFEKASQGGLTDNIADCRDAIRTDYRGHWWAQFVDEHFTQAEPLVEKRNETVHAVWLDFSHYDPPPDQRTAFYQPRRESALHIDRTFDQLESLATQLEEASLDLLLDHWWIERDHDPDHPAPNPMDDPELQ